MAVVAGVDGLLEKGCGEGLEIKGGGIAEVAQGPGVLIGQLVEAVLEGNEQLKAVELKHLLGGIHYAGILMAQELLPESDGFRAAAQVHKGAGAVVVDPGAVMASVEGAIEQGEGGSGLTPLPQLDGHGDQRVGAVALVRLLLEQLHSLAEAAIADQGLRF